MGSSDDNRMIVSSHPMNANAILSNSKQVATVFVIISLLVFIVDFYGGASAESESDSKGTESNSRSALPIEHVIVVIQDGRSFDHYFGRYPGANGITNQTAIPENPLNEEEEGKLVKPFHLESTRTLSPLNTAIFNRLAYNNGSMDGFVHAQSLYGYNGSMTLGYYDYRDIPYYWNLASQYVLADNFFSPTMSTGLANYLYFYAVEQPVGYATSIVPKRGLDIYTIFDLLQQHKIDWRVYMRNYDPSLNYTNPLVRTKELSDTQLVRNPLLAIPRFVSNETLNSNMDDLSEYFNDLKNEDDFPNVVYILAPGFNEKAPSNLKSGQEFVTSLILALMQSGHWRDSALILTYANSGGWYDHVPPPYREEEQTQNGFRVPSLIISPYAKRGYIDSTLYDAGSLLKFIQYIFDIPPYAKSEELVTNNMLNAFDFESSPREPFIPPMSYTEQSAEKSDSNHILNTNTVQMIYGIVLTILVSIGIFLFFNHRTSTIFPFSRRDTKKEGNHWRGSWI